MPISSPNKSQPKLGKKESERIDIMYQLNSKEDRQYVPGDEETELQCPPLSVSWSVDSDVIRSLASCAMAKCKSFL